MFFSSVKLLEFGRTKLGVLSSVSNIIFYNPIFAINFLGPDLVGTAKTPTSIPISFGSTGRGL